MSPVRTFNVLTLTAILLLAGCFGLGDSAEAAEEDEDTTVTATLTAQDIADAMTLSSNSPPEITVKTYSFDEDGVVSNWEVAGLVTCPPEDGWDDLPATFAEQEAGMGDIGFILPEFISSGKCIANFAFASVDPDGDTMTKGIDLDLDGLIDIPIVHANGQVIFGMDNSSLYDWPVFISIGGEAEDAQIANVALIAIDEHGASTAQIIHFVAPCWDCDDDDDDGGLDLYQFEDRDAAHDLTATGGDDLIHVQMMQGSALSWDLLGVSIVVDGGTMNNCVEASEADVDGLLCTYTLPNSFSAWEIGDEITISEGANADLCDGVAGFCEVTVTLTKEVDSAGMVIAMFTAIVE
jgi:hypothetical protein